MKRIKLFAIISLLTAETLSLVSARNVSVKSYYKPSKGTYVMPSYRTSPNHTKIDNYGTQGNYNPYTGKSGTKPY